MYIYITFVFASCRMQTRHDSYISVTWDQHRRHNPCIRHMKLICIHDYMYMYVCVCIYTYLHVYVCCVYVHINISCVLLCGTNADIAVGLHFLWICYQGLPSYGNISICANRTILFLLNLCTLIHVCTCIYRYLYIYVCICVCIYVHVSIYIRQCKYTHIWICMYITINTYSCMCICVYLYKHIFNMYTCVYLYTYISIIWTCKAKIAPNLLCWKSRIYWL